MTAPPPRPGSRPVLVLATSFTLVFFPFPVILLQLASDRTFFYRVLVLLADIPLAVVSAAVIWLLLARRARPARGALLGAALLALLAVAFVFHPSPQGAQTLLRLGGVLCLAMAISWLSPQERGLAIGAFAAGAIAQAGLAFAQLANGGPLGLNGLGEFADPLLKAHDSLVPRGTMYHPYILAGFAALAGCLLALQGVRSPRPAPWLAAAALAVSPVGVAYSRSGPLAVALVCAGLALAARARPKAHAAAIAALVIGVGIPALVQIDGWIAPTRPTLLNGREIFVAENLVLFERSPIVGIGPGRSVIELRRLMGDDPVLDAFLQPVHDVPGLAAVEGGVAAGLAAALLLAVLAWRTRRDALAFAVLGTILPYFLLDHWPYTYAQGLVLTGVWLGMLDARAATPARAPEARS